MRFQPSYTTIISNLFFSTLSIVLCLPVHYRFYANNEFICIRTFFHFKLHSQLKIENLFVAIAAQLNSNISKSQWSLCIKNLIPKRPNINEKLLSGPNCPECATIFFWAQHSLWHQQQTAKVSQKREPIGKEK